MKIIQIAERLSRVRSLLVAMEKYGQRQMESIHEGYRYAAREWELPQSCIFPKKSAGVEHSRELPQPNGCSPPFLRRVGRPFPGLPASADGQCAAAFGWLLCPSMNIPHPIATSTSFPPIHADNTPQGVRFTESGANLGVLRPVHQCSPDIHTRAAAEGVEPLQGEAALREQTVGSIGHRDGWGCDQQEGD